MKLAKGSVFRVGDPVFIESDGARFDGNCVGQYKAIYVGNAHSYSVGPLRFRTGQTCMFDDDALCKRLVGTKDVIVTIARKTQFRVGRVLTVFEDAGNDLRAVAFGGDVDCYYDFLVVAPNGNVMSADTIRSVTEEEQAQLREIELNLLLDSEEPYCGHLEFKGKGKWGAR